MYKANLWIKLSILFTYALIFIGGFVRVTDSGLGCPDWPKCFDGWYPPLSIADIPDDFTQYYDNYNCTDGETCEQFDISKAWIEYLNRLFGAITGIVITIMLFHLFKLKSNYKIAFYCALGAFVLTGIEGLIGKFVVTSHLEGNIITIHLLLALIIVSLLIISYSLINFKKQSIYKTEQVNIVKWIFVFMIVGIVLGTQVRESIENFIPLAMMGPFKYVHSFLGLGTLMMTGVLWNKVQDDLQITTKREIKWLLNILVIQIGTGYFLVFGGLPSYAKLIHMWLASSGIGLIVYILIDTKLSVVE
jgi:cytochrome c oxidase assembly protein subunit 15|tara:strand:+ start:1835 stop:2746 length:912 start_codon:yes stop_codon:yes gene_type:complete